MVWVETFQVTRFHSFSPGSLTHKWMIFYLVTTVFLYIMLILLYSLFLFFTGHTASRILDAIYVTLALVDLTVPLVLGFARCCLTLMYAGFPFRYVRHSRLWFLEWLVLVVADS